MIVAYPIYFNFSQLGYLIVKRHWAKRKWPYIILLLLLLLLLLILLHNL